MNEEKEEDHPFAFIIKNFYLIENKRNLFWMDSPAWQLIFINKGKFKTFNYYLLVFA